MSFKMTRWRGIPMLAWIAQIAVLTGAGALIDGISPRAAWAQVEVFVTNFLGNSVTSYGRRADGNVAPVRIISGPATELENPAGLAVDTVNNEILVANVSSITVYSLTASGNVAPKRTISGTDTELAQPIGLAVDTVNDEVLVANVSSITVYRRTAGGLPGSADANVKPLRTISGPKTRLLNPAGLAVDPVNNEILVANTSSFSDPTDIPSITVYGRTAGGLAGSADANVKPLRTISGADTELVQPIGLAVDTVNDHVLVANASSITAYSRAAGGPRGSASANVKPLRIISGELTKLDHPLGLGFDAVTSEVLVANLGNPFAAGGEDGVRSPAITVYGQTAGGPPGSATVDVKPLRTISGELTELSAPAFPVVATTGCPSRYDFDFRRDTYSRCFRELLRGSEITAGQDLGNTGHTSLNVVGSSGTTPTTWLTVYDTPPAVAPTGVQTLCADVQIVPFNNTKGAGVVALLNEGPGQKGLALVIHEAGNTDTLLLATVDPNPDPGKKGKLKTLETLASASLQEGISGKKNWYRLIMTVDPATAKVTGEVFRHSTPKDPNSALGVRVAPPLTYQPASGALPDGVTSPGKHGVVASSINAVLNVSLTNFTNDATLCGP
jgi:hypothetical protein